MVDHATSLAKTFMTRMLMCNLFVVANVLVLILGYISLLMIIFFLSMIDMYNGRLRNCDHLMHWMIRFTAVWTVDHNGRCVGLTVQSIMSLRCR